MPKLGASLAAGLLLSSGFAAGPVQAIEGQTEPAACEPGSLIRAPELYASLGRLAVEVMERARRANWADDPRLARLVSQEAAFRLGAGDISNWRQGVGVPGAHALATSMPMDEFRFSDWTGPPPPLLDRCGDYEIEVEFVDASASRKATMKFQFVAGQVRSANGWVRSFTEGALAAR